MEQEKMRATTRNTPTGSRSSRRGCRCRRACRSIASLRLAEGYLRLAVALSSLPRSDGSRKGIHLAAAFGSQRVVVVVVLKWGNEQHFTTSTSIEQLPAGLGNRIEAIVADKYHRHPSLNRPVNNGSFTRTDSWRDEYCSVGKQAVTFARYFLLTHAS